MLWPKPFHCVTGYRLWHPYLEFKVHSDNQQDFNAVVAHFDQAVQPYVIGDGKQTASALLREKLAVSNIVFTISDQATGGALETALKTPTTFTHIEFHPTKKNLPRIEINGLTEYWQGKTDVTRTEIEIIFSLENNQEHRIHTEIPLRGKRVIQYAVEFVCDKIDKMLFKDAAS